MNRVLAGGLLVVLVLAGMFQSLVTLTLVPYAPLHLHRWWPLPAVCAGIRCVTYAQWSAAVRRSDVPNQEAADILSQLLWNRAATLVAHRAGLAVSDDEVDAALRVLGTTTAAEPTIENFLATQAVDLQSREFRHGMRALLLQGKLAAAGITNVWGHPAAPSVTMLHARYRWNDRTHQVERR